MILLFCLSSSFLFAQEMVVAKDGSGSYASIQSAIDAAPDQSQQAVIIHVKPGFYKEKIVVPSWKTNIQLIAEDAATTIISWDDHAGKNGHNTFTSYTMLVQGSGFRAENLTIENTAGRDVGQAVALHVEADQSVFVNCRLVANQDTLYAGVGSSRQYFVNCYIEGTTDFIFGPATAVFDRCHIHGKKNSYITAASTPQDKAYGFVFLDCKITADESVSKLYLGRPWRPFAKTVFINCILDADVVPEGWHNWNKPEAEETVYYAEYNSTGRGANKEKRIKWTHQIKESELHKFSLDVIFNGWSPID